MTKIVRPVATAAVLLVGGTYSITACGDDVPVYSKDTVCGVEMKAVQAIMGTDRFTVGQSVTRSTADASPAPSDGALPLASGSGGVTRMGCDVRTTADAPTLSFSFSLSNRVDADDMVDAINASEQPYETQGGIATTSFVGNNHASWRWVCTTPTESSIPIAGGSIGQEGVTEEQRRALVDAVAAAAGCPHHDPSKP